MIDSHCHLGFGGNSAARRIICAAHRADWSAPLDFYGIHPWYAEELDLAALKEVLLSHPEAGVGEIGLDRLRDRTIGDIQRRAFESQLALAAELRRPVTLHGAKCWGEVVKACLPYRGVIPAFLFHGFSRSAGLIPDIVALNGFISVGPAVLNDHAVNYRELVAALPKDRILAETDGGEGKEADVAAVYAKITELTALAESDLDANTARFLSRN